MNINHKNVELDYQYDDRIKDIIFQPIFIMGLQRSGTSILYKILATTKLFNPINAYHIIKYDELLYNHINKRELTVKNDLLEFLKSNSQTDRSIDKLKINPDFPEEYGFLLGKKTKYSNLNSKNLHVFVDLCKKTQFISENKKPLLLKNPWDFQNFLYIKKVFPNAKFIFIHRNPLKTLNSQINAMRTLLQNKSAYMAILSPGYNELFNHKLSLHYYKFLYSSNLPIRSNQAMRRMKKTTSQFLKDINKLEKTEYINITYENLCKQPNIVITNILKFLDMPFPEKINYQEYVKPRKTEELKEINKIKKIALKKLQSYISYCGYNKEELINLT